MDFATKDLLEILGLLLTNAISFGVLKANVSESKEKIRRLEVRIDTLDTKVNDHSVSMAELNANMTNVMTKLTVIEEKLDRVLTGGK